MAASESFPDLEDVFAGRVIRPGDDAYGTARTVFNGMIDRKPAVIARCAGVADVRAALAFAREQGLAVAVRGGGHGVAGNAVCDGGLVIDLSAMKGIRVDPVRRSAQAQGGVTWGELDRETQAFGLAVTGGRVSTTGIAGLTLGGGSGWLERKLGLACDNLLSADVVTADGRFLVVSATEHPDLFWGLRGGGGNFGIVTAFTYQLHPVGPVVYGGMVLHTMDRAEEVVRCYRDFMAAAPDEVGGAAAFVTAPPAPFVPAHLQGQPVVGLILTYAGAAEDGEAALRPVRELGPPEVDLVGPIPYVALQQLLDPGAPPGLRNYWKSDTMSELSDAPIAVLVERLRPWLSPHTQIVFAPFGGAVARMDAQATAVGWRDAAWYFEVMSTWTDPADDERQIAWTRALADALRPWTRDASYLNTISDEGLDQVQASYGPERYARLVALKNAYDPDNVFRLNQNIPPTPGYHATGIVS
ncbi:MAG: FAD-binding oxidoreductase [Egibacteraceae bacterium]